MDNALFETDVFTGSRNTSVFRERPRHDDEDRPRPRKTEVWMPAAAVKATVAASALACVVLLPGGMNSRPVVDRYVVESEVCVDQDTPSWMHPIADRIRRFQRLEPGWDSYGAPAVATAAIDRIIDLLESVAIGDTPPPSIAPTSDGGVQVEWHERGFDLELRTDDQGRLFAFFEDHRTGDTWDDELKEPELASTWVDRLSAA